MPLRKFVGLHNLCIGLSTETCLELRQGGISQLLPSSGFQVLWIDLSELWLHRYTHVMDLPSFAPGTYQSFYGILWMLFEGVPFLNRVYNEFVRRFVYCTVRIYLARPSLIAWSTYSREFMRIVLGIVHFERFGFCDEVNQVPSNHASIRSLYGTHRFTGPPWWALDACSWKHRM